MSSIPLRRVKFLTRSSSSALVRLSAARRLSKFFILASAPARSSFIVNNSMRISRKWRRSDEVWRAKVSSFKILYKSVPSFMDSRMSAGTVLATLMLLTDHTMTKLEIDSFIPYNSTYEPSCSPAHPFRGCR